MTPPNPVQSKSSVGTDSTPANMVAVTFTAPVTSGGLVWGGVTWGTPTLTELTSVTDDKGNTYTIVRKIADTTDGQSAASFYLANITNAPTIITANFSVNLGFRAISVQELSGTPTSSALDQETGQQQIAPTTVTDALTSGLVTTLNTDEYIAGYSVHSANAQIPAAGTGFSNSVSSGNGTSAVASRLEGKTLASPLAVAATFTAGANDRHLTFVMTFKNNGGSPPVVNSNFFLTF